MTKSRFSKTNRNTEIPVKFPVLYEVHPLKEFQAEGHFVPAIRERDAQGNPTMQPRKWKGTQVHALSLIDPETGTPARITDPQTGKDQAVARALSDSREDAERILSDQIRNAVLAASRSTAIANFAMEQARRVKDERDRLVNYMLANGQNLGAALGIAEAAVEEFKRQEADPALKSKVNELLQRGIV